MVPSVEETMDPEHPRCMARENALRKHLWCRDRQPDAHIITADTVIDFEGTCIGKPSSLEDAATLFRAFSGKTHIVITATGLSHPDSTPEIILMESSVTFRELADADIQAYFADVDPMDKAGAYDIDQHGDLIVTSFEGSRTNIMGIPVEIIAPWLTKEGFITRQIKS